MYIGDHAPPHFHPEYAGREIRMSIRARRIMDGSLPPRQTRLDIDWAAMREAELLAAWERASNNEAPAAIDPL